MDDVAIGVEEDTAVEETLPGVEDAAPMFMQANDIFVVVALVSERAASDHFMST